MPPPHFDESIRAEKLPLEVLKWMNSASSYARNTPDSVEEVFGSLKLVLRLLAVRNPDSQSHATRKALGMLIESLYEQPGSEKVCSELLDLLVRIVDAKQGYKYNPMKHLAISGLGHLSKYLSQNMRQMSANVFIICIEAMKVAPVMPQTVWYRNTILWTLQQSAATTVDEKSITQAYQIAKSVIESGGSSSNYDSESVVRAFELLAALVILPNAKFTSKSQSSLNQLYQDHGLLAVSGDEQIADAAARFYSSYLVVINGNSARTEILKTISLYEKQLVTLHTNKMTKRTPQRISGYARLLKHLVSHIDSTDEHFMADLDEVYIPNLLTLDHNLAKLLIVDSIIVDKLGTDLAGIETLGMLLRQLALAQSPPIAKGKSKDATPKPKTESTLACLGSVVDLLGNAVQPIASSIHQATFGLAMNSNTPLNDLQLGLIIFTLQRLSHSVPLLITSTINLAVKQFEVSTMNDRRKELGYIVGAMISESKNFPLYGDLDLNVRVLLMGLEFIKKPSDIVAYKVGWLLLQGVLCLGSTIIKPMVPQILGLFETHLKYISLDQPTSALKIEHTLTGLVVFLLHNKELLTGDVSSRISQSLYSLWTETESASTSPGLKRRLLQSFKIMLELRKLDPYPASLLLKYVAHTTNPSPYSKFTGVVLESAITTPSSAAAATSSSSKNSSMGSLKFSAGDTLDSVSMTECGMASRLDDDPRASLSNDIDSLVFFNENFIADRLNSSFPTDVFTAVVDESIDVVAKLLPLQPERIKESVFDTILSNLENGRTSKSLRGHAIIFNTAKLVNMIFKSNNLILEDRVLNIVVSLIKSLLSVPYSDIQSFTLQSCGFLASLLRSDSLRTSTLASLVKDIIDLAIAANVHDIPRSAYILSLGYIAEQWPNVSLLEAIFKVLMPLAALPDPAVHTSALASMRRVLMSTEMIDQRYVKCTLKTIGLTILLDSHNNNPGFRREVAEALVLIVSRIGPVLSTDSQKNNRELIVCLVDQLQFSSKPGIRVLAWKSFIELYYYSRRGITWSLLIKRWRNIIINSSSRNEEVDAAVNGLLMLMKLSASTIFSVAGGGLEDALWLLLDRQPRHPAIINLFDIWLSQTTENDSEISAWVNKLSSVVMKPRFFFVNRLHNTLNPKNADNLRGHEKDAAINPTAIAADEDVTLNVKSEDSSNDQFSWEARAFAIELLLKILRKDVGGIDMSEKKERVTSKKVGDIIKIAFSSATSNILGLQYAGLSLLNEVMVQYGDLADPDFPHISLLEQYQVQILSAISPAFSRDSTPSVAFVALRTCSTFLTSRIVKSKEKLNRLVKILEGFILSMKNGDLTFKLGQIEMTSDSSKMFRVAVLSVWAQMENHSSENEYLEDIVSPWRDDLVSLWTEAIYDYGRLRSSLDSQWSVTSLDDLVDQMKDTQLHYLMQPVYQITWVSIVQALANVATSQNQVSPLVLCGLCFQDLIENLQHSGNTSENELAQVEAVRATGLFNRNNIAVASTPSVHEYRLSILQTLMKLLTPQISQLVITSSEYYFDEIVPILYRVMVNGNADEQSCVLTIARNLVAGQPETDDSVDHFFEVLKIAMQPLRSLLPKVFDPSINLPNSGGLDHNQISLLRQTMDTLIDITQVFREVIQNDLWLCLLRIFEELNHYEPAVAAPSFKKLLEILAAQAEQRGITFIIGALTASIKKAVDKENTAEALLVSSALTCTNSNILLNPGSLREVERFGARAGEILNSVAEVEKTESDEQTELLKDAEVALQCITAVMKVCSNTPSGGAFSYGSLPGLVKLATLATSDPYLLNLSTQALRALVIYAALDGSLGSFSVVVPVLVQHASLEGNNSAHAQQLLLQLATKQSSTFKDTVWLMDEDDRSVLQQLLAKQATEAKRSAESYSDDDDDEDDAGEIELKSFV